MEVRGDFWSSDLCYFLGVDDFFKSFVCVCFDEAVVLVVAPARSGGSQRTRCV